MIGAAMGSERSGAVDSFRDLTRVLQADDFASARNTPQRSWMPVAAAQAATLLAARSSPGWTTQDLACEAGLGANRINRFEAGQDALASSVDKRRAAL